MTGGRFWLGAAGIVVVVFGSVLVLSRPTEIPSVALWFLGPVILHDGFVALGAVVVGILGQRLPAPVRRPFLVALVVSAGLTIVAFPLLGRPGAIPDNPTLLPRDYLLGWLVALALVWVCAGAWAAAALARERSRTGRQAPSGEVAVRR